MDWLKLIELVTGFYIGIFHYLAWPVVAVAVVLTFRKEIMILFARPIKARFKDLTIEVLRDDMQEQIITEPAKFDIVAVDRDTCNYDAYLHLLESYGMTMSVFYLGYFSEGRKAGKEPDKAICMFIKRIFAKLQRERSESMAVRVMGRAWGAIETLYGPF